MLGLGNLFFPSKFLDKMFPLDNLFFPRSF
jgi:hypothetical protein